MSFVRRLGRAAAAAALAGGLALAGCGGEPAEGHRGHGVIEAVDAVRGEVTIDHGDIPGLMKAMTMTFSVSDPALLAGLAPGQQVDFAVKEEAGRYVVTRVERSGR